MPDSKHRNDIYGDLEQSPKSVPALIPAATAVLLKEDESGFKVLMLKKNASISFGGMWVFPGGKIDAEDYPEGHQQDQDKQIERAARNAVAREIEEETGIVTEASEFAFFAHWTPPATTPKRFTTWFYAIEIKGNSLVSVDGGEILEHQWVRPQEALALHDAGKIDLAPPTWVSLYQLGLFDELSMALDTLHKQPEKVYETHIAQRNDGVRIAMWQGDAGYESMDADAPGERHRLVMEKSGFIFENTSEDYFVK